MICDLRTCFLLFKEKNTWLNVHYQLYVFGSSLYSPGFHEKENTVVFVNNWTLIYRCPALPHSVHLQRMVAALTSIEGFGYN